MKTLALLDLDHTLIYGSYAPTEETELLFSYSTYLKVYKRPFVDAFVEKLNQTFDTIIVFTTAKEDYAQEIIRLLRIDCAKLLSRVDCDYKNDRHYKIFRETWGETYDHISIIDDSPHVWRETEAYEKKISFVVPPEFRGEKADTVLSDLKVQ